MPNPKRGEIWHVNFDRVVVLITGWGRLAKKSAADALQIRNVSLARFGDYVGKLSALMVDEIAASITICVGAPRQE
jgi:mRNA-degrading endonuclease toxin of MazEF toxin-antitoxin module